MTALVRDLKSAWPDTQLDVITNFKDAVWRHNPYLTPLRVGDPGVQHMILCYGEGIQRAGRGEKIHFISEFHHSFFKSTTVRVPLMIAKPDMHLGPDELAEPIVAGRYWAVVAGGKLDYTNKHWDYRRVQTVVDILASFGIRCVQLGEISDMSFHPRLKGVLDLLDRTTLRETFRIIAGADGVLCPVTMAMHAAAAFERPCVVWAGGREEYYWEAYHPDSPAFAHVPTQIKIGHRFLHTQGLLDCCMHKGCWKSRIERIGHIRNKHNKSICYHPAGDAVQRIPQCMDMISPEMVAEAVLSYYADGTLAPIEAAS